ncbi:MAG TPA: hypothetical protein VGK28_07080 [Candidatus Dormibacteraeota bacterium]
MSYAAPRLTFSSELATRHANSEWWVVGALALILLVFGSTGAWCWFVCNGRVSSCFVDWFHLTVYARCY